MPALRRIGRCNSATPRSRWAAWGPRPPLHDFRPLRHTATRPAGANRAVRESLISRPHPRTLNEEELKRLTKEDLVILARDESLPNRSKMNKAQLARTLRRHYRKAR